MDIKIISDQKDYLVVLKPAGLIVHRGKGIKEKTLIDYILEKYPEIEKVGDDPDRPGIVHRLDKDASGLMIITKNNDSFEYFKNQFKNRKVKKEYTALVCGQIAKEYGVIDFPIKRSSQGYKMAAIPSPQNEEEETLLKAGKGEYQKHSKEEETEDEEGEEEEYRGKTNRAKGNLKALEKSRQAITEFKVIKEFINFTLLKVIIKTGRTHQIRVHFYAYGNPLLGDMLYKNKKSKIQTQKVKPGRIFLMADCLGFYDQENNWQEFNADLDQNLKDILKKVK
jgi:23S rRNA pseudouridine1911/1915/1917 synthase